MKASLLVRGDSAELMGIPWLSDDKRPMKVATLAFITGWPTFLVTNSLSNPVIH